MATLDFVLMCGKLASHHDTALAHAMLHAVAVWKSRRGDRAAPGGARHTLGTRKDGAHAGRG